MGLLGKIKSFWRIMSMKKQLKKSVAESKEKEAQSFTMSENELSALSDDDLFCRSCQNGEKVRRLLRMGRRRCVVEPFAEGVLFIELDGMGVNNGGLCQFFVNSSRMVAPFMSEYMKNVLQALISAYKQRRKAA